MTDIDSRIRGALDEDDRAFLATLDQDRGLFTQVGDVFSGPLGGWAKLVFVVTIPMALETDSLNVSVAAGILMYHYRPDPSR